MQTHISEEFSHYTAFFLNRSSRKLCPASKHKLSTDGSLACSHFIDLKGRCFSKLNWNCLNSNTVNKKKPSFPPHLPSFPSLTNQGNPMSKAVNGKRQNRKVGSCREHMIKLVFTFIALPTSAFLIKYVTISTELTGVRSSASLSQKHFTPHTRSVSRYAATWLVFSMPLHDGDESGSSKWWWKDLEEVKETSRADVLQAESSLSHFLVQLPAFHVTKPPDSSGLGSISE